MYVFFYCFILFCLCHIKAYIKVRSIVLKISQIGLHLSQWLKYLKQRSQEMCPPQSRPALSRPVAAPLPCCCSSQQEFQPPGLKLVSVTCFHGILLSGNQKTRRGEKKLRAATSAGFIGRSQFDEWTIDAGGGAEIRTGEKTQGGEKYYCNIMAHLWTTLDCLLAASLSRGGSGVRTTFCSGR